MNKKRNPQKRGEFVPIRDIAVDLPGVKVKALSERAPQARHHFTRLDQIDQLVDASEADAPVYWLEDKSATLVFSTKAYDFGLFCTTKHPDWKTVIFDQTPGVRTSSTDQVVLIQIRQAGGLLISDCRLMSEKGSTRPPNAGTDEGIGNTPTDFPQLNGRPTVTSPNTHSPTAPDSLRSPGA